jgi:hypothetical protein
VGWGEQEGPRGGLGSWQGSELRSPGAGPPTERIPDVDAADHPTCVDIRGSAMENQVWESAGDGGRARMSLS